MRSQIFIFALLSSDIMRKSPLFVLFITIFIDLVGFGLVIPILPLFAQDLGASEALIGLIAGSFSLMQFFFAPVWGGLSDRFGRKPIIISSVFINAFAYLLFSHSTSILLLFASRVLSGIGSANISAAQAYISDVTPPEKRAKSFGIIGAAFGLGFIFGPPIGGFLKMQYGVGMVGYVAAGLCAFNILVATFLLPESLKVKNRKAKIFLSPFGNFKRIQGMPEVRKLIFINLVFIAAFSMMHVTSTLLWESKYHRTAAEIGYLFMYIGVLSAVFQGTLIGFFQRRLGEQKMLVLGCLSMAIGLASLPFVPPAYFMPLEYLSLLMMVMGNSLLMPTTTSLISKMVSPGEQGKILGINQSFASLGRFIGPMVGGALYGIVYHMPFWVGGLLMLLVMSLAVRFVRAHVRT